MQLTSIRAGDIVSVDKKGRRFLAYVTAKTPGQNGGPGSVALSPLERNVSYRSATSSEIVGHWARRGRTAMPAAVPAAEKVAVVAV